jgi:hypothetical protein
MCVARRLLRTASTTPQQQKGPAGYDLHTSHASSGATDERTVPYVRLIWPRELSDQVPHTFPPAAPSASNQPLPAFSPAAMAGPAGQQQYRQLVEQLKKVKNVKYCFDYAKKVTHLLLRACVRACGDACVAWRGVACVRACVACVRAVCDLI